MIELIFVIFYHVGFIVLHSGSMSTQMLPEGKQNFPILTHNVVQGNFFQIIFIIILLLETFFQAE